MSIIFLERLHSSLHESEGDNIDGRNQLPCPSISTSASVTSETSSNEHSDQEEGGADAGELLQVHNLRYSGYLRNAYLKFMRNTNDHPTKAANERRRCVAEWIAIMARSYSLGVEFRGPILCSAALISLIPSPYSLIGCVLNVPLLLLVLGMLVTILDICQQSRRSFTACQVFVIRWLNDQLILDELLLAIVRAVQRFILVIGSVFSLYSLPLSQQRRVEVIDSVFPSERFGEQNLTASEVLTTRGGILSLLPKSYRELLIKSVSLENSKGLISHPQDRVPSALPGEDLVWDVSPFVSNVDTDHRSVIQARCGVRTACPVATSTSNLYFNIAKECLPGWIGNPLSFICKDEILHKMGISAFAGLFIHLRSSKLARRTISNLLHTAGILGFSGVLLTCISMVCFKRNVPNIQDNRPATTKTSNRNTLELKHTVRQLPSVTTVAENATPSEDYNLASDKRSRPKSWLFRIIAYIHSTHQSRHLQAGLALFVIALMKRRFLLRQ